MQTEITRAQPINGLHCHASGCLAHVPAGGFMCPKHTAMLTDEQRIAVRGSLLWLKDGGTPWLGALYRAAACEAMLHVARLEGRATFALVACASRWRAEAEKAERAGELLVS